MNVILELITLMRVFQRMFSHICWFSKKNVDQQSCMFTTKGKAAGIYAGSSSGVSEPSRAISGYCDTQPFMWDFFNPLIFMASRLIIKSIQPQVTKVNRTSQSIQGVSAVRNLSQQSKALNSLSEPQDQYRFPCFILATTIN